ncbi:MAG: hypothetical protein HFG74_03010 [Hungatella sp.]|nr:hypothetical protein [Hungatella sp.]
MRLVWFLCLTAAAISDVKERTVSYRILIICGVCGALYGWKTGIAGHAAGVILGFGILTLSKGTRGAVGEGDGWFLAASAGYLEPGEIWILLLGGLAVSWVWGAGMILYRACHGKSANKETLPFLACLWPAGVWILLRKEGIMWLLAAGRGVSFLQV